MQRATLLERALERIGARDAGEDPLLVRPHADLLLLRHRRPTQKEATFYDPVICLILQGRKETYLGGERLAFGPGESLIVSHGLPVVSSVTEATMSSPYVALILSVDLPLLRSLHHEIGQIEEEPRPPRALEVRETDEALLGALGRYLALTEDPIEAKVMGPLIRKEIHFRLLRAPHGAMLRQLLRQDSHAHSVARAIEHIRAGFREVLAVPELARAVGMSSSSFHKHFKAITSTTPLQYQKHLRLLEARRLLREGSRTVATAAYEVGYESPTQFSREYVRKFGSPPRIDLAATP